MFYENKQSFATAQLSQKAPLRFLVADTPPTLKTVQFKSFMHFLEAIFRGGCSLSSSKSKTFSEGVFVSVAKGLFGGNFY